MGPDPSPDHMRLAGDDLVAVLKCGAAIGRPAHLPNANAPLHAFDPEAGVEVLHGDTEDEELQRGEKRCSLVWLEGCPVPQEPGKLVVGRHRLRGVICGGRVQMRDELLGAVMHHALTAGELFVGFAFSGLPRWRPEPGLVGIDRPLDNAA
jgi:hypothetical protein